MPCSYQSSKKNKCEKRIVIIDISFGEINVFAQNLLKEEQICNLKAIVTLVPL